VIVFLPQILILVPDFIMLLEASGLHDRAAFIQGRLMASVGLSDRRLHSVIFSFALRPFPGFMADAQHFPIKDRPDTYWLRR